MRKQAHVHKEPAAVFQKERGRLLPDPNNYQTIYALQGSLRKFPLEASLESERRAERKRENARAVMVTELPSPPLSTLEHQSFYPLSAIR